jgi:hypothetical protein
MARSFRYPPNGQPGEIPVGHYVLDVNSFGNAETLLWSVSFTSPLPGTEADLLAQIVVKFDTDGSFATFGLHGGVHPDKQGNPLNVVNGAFGGPQTEDGQPKPKNALAGTYTIDVFIPFTALVEGEAV